MQEHNGVAGSSPGPLDGLDEAVLADLERVGLLTSEYHGPLRKMRIVDQALRLFAPVLTEYEVRLVPMDRAECPVRFCTGLAKPALAKGAQPAGLPGPIPAGGQGDEMRNAALGCLGELAERLSLCSLGDQDPRVFAAHNEQPEVDFRRIAGLRAQQEDAASPGGCQEDDKLRDSAVDRSEAPSRRVALRNLINGDQAQFPAFGVLFQEIERPGAGYPSIASTVGCAVWTDADGARERALLELVERDAVAQAWYNRLGITFLPPTLIGDSLPEQYVAYLNARPRQWGLYHVASDLPVPVAMAISSDKNGFRCAFGSSAGWTLASACRSAVEEMLQSENALDLMEEAFPAGQQDVRVPRQLAYARTRSIFEDLGLRDLPPAEKSRIIPETGYEELVAACAAQGHTIWEFDATRPDLAIPCIKLLSPDLCTPEPRFAKRRLFEGVVKRGLRACPASEAEFAARPFPF